MRAYDLARYNNEIYALLIVLFPEFTQVFADPTRPTALDLLKRYLSAQAMTAAGIEATTATLRELAPRHFGLKNRVALAAAGTAVRKQWSRHFRMCEEFSRALRSTRARTNEPHAVGRGNRLSSGG